VIKYYLLCLQTRVTMTIQSQALAVRLKNLRKKRGLSQYDLEDESGVNRCTITRIESGAVIYPKDHTIRDLAKSLGSTFEYLMFGITAPDYFKDDVRALGIRINKITDDAKRKKFLDVFNDTLDLCGVR